MPVRKPKPTSPGMRFVSYPDFAEITKSTPENVGVTDLLGAARLLVSEGALDALTARTGKPRSAEEAKA